MKLTKNLVVLTSFLFGSCATFINTSTVRINVYSDTDSIKIRTDNDTAKWHNLPAKLDVMRSKNDLLITAVKDTVHNEIRVKSRSSIEFIWGNISNCGIGYIVERNNPKRYTYPKTVFIDLERNKPIAAYKMWRKPKKHFWNLKIAIPDGNHFYMNKENRYGESFGFLGISSGFEYYFSDKYCINMDVGGLIDFIAPVPAPYDFEGSYNNSSAVFIDLQAGRDYKRLHYDAGIQFTRTFYYEYNELEPPTELIPAEYIEYSKQQNNIGLAFSAYYRLTRLFNLGINYYPSFFVIENMKPQLQYSHILFFEISFRIGLYKMRR
jgi:hypothetical protein